MSEEEKRTVKDESLPDIYNTETVRCGLATQRDNTVCLVQLDAGTNLSVGHVQNII